MKWNHGVRHVILQAAICFHKNILDDVADVHALHNSLVQSKLDHATQRISMPIHQLIDGKGLAILHID
jgi:hypothetical protein